MQVASHRSSRIWAAFARFNLAKIVVQAQVSHGFRQVPPIETGSSADVEDGGIAELREMRRESRQRDSYAECDLRQVVQMWWQSCHVEMPGLATAVRSRA